MSTQTLTKKYTNKTNIKRDIIKAYLDIIEAEDKGAAIERLPVCVHAHVRPHIESRYPTSGVWGLMGTSLGGLISLAIADRYPDAYDFCASLSGTLGWGAYDPETEAPMTMRRQFETTAAAGLNAALQKAARHSADGGAESLLVLPGDLPLIDLAEISELHRLVQQQQLRLRRQRPRQLHTLFQAIRQA